MKKNIIENFHKLSSEERREVLTTLGLFDSSLNETTSAHIFEHLVENYVATFEVGMGIAPNFLIDDKIYHVPLATEEPSVIAASSNASKIIRLNGGFTTKSISRLTIGQIIFKNVKDQTLLEKYLHKNFEEFKTVAATAHKEIYRRGGGVIKFEVAAKGNDFVTLYVYIDTKEAMGANIVNTILEALAHYISSHYESEVLMAIISNLALGSLVTMSVSIDPSTLKNSQDIANNISLAYDYVCLDPFRAATHNKGVMNGISALMLATGNDTRSIEASAHAYASLSGTYQPLTKWWVEEGLLKGEITIPLAVGVVGGAISLLPKAQLALKILNIKKAEQLMKVAAAVGLAQNFAALYALTTEGINKGHLRLHARSVALLAGATKDNVETVVHHMIKEKAINVSSAKKFIDENFK